MVGRRFTVCLFLALLFVAVVARAASRPAAEQAKIDFLLAEVKNSQATFIRNGKEYPAEKAVSHLRTKLLFAGKRVQTARDFITGVASHSEETGKPYEVRLTDGVQRPFGDWLLERLAVYEKTFSAPRPTPKR